MTAIEVRRAADRFRTSGATGECAHSFSFGSHYDPGNTSYGLLLAHNEDVVRPGQGYPMHPHSDLEIVTWVLSGALVHEDSSGRRAVLAPGAVQRLSAGGGVLHAESNDAWRVTGGPSHGAPLHLVQMWVSPDCRGGDAMYEQCDVTAELAAGGLVPVASGMTRHRGTAGVRIRQRQAALHVARLRPGEGVTLPDAPYLHLFVAAGVVDLPDTGPLGPGDAVRAGGAGGLRITATAAAEVLVWEMHADLARAVGRCP